jgi:TolB-like protein/Flp pilus assembly protein TadD
MTAMSEHLSFDQFRFEPLTARLWKGEQEVKLTRKAAAVLSVLVGRSGEPVTKQDLFATVWSNTIVSDDALATCIQEIRKALGDDAKQPRYIETRHRYGYRFAGTLSAREQQKPLPAKTLAHDVATIAVLPFSDMSPGRDQDFFCEGIAEELIDALTHIEGLRVAARSSSFQFRGGATDVREVGQRLGVGALLEGSVRKAGERLRITVQLIDVASGYHKWSQTFERQVGDVFAVQDEIAASVATTLRGGALSQREQTALRRQHTAAETYEYFLRGRQHLHRMRRPDLEQSKRMFEQAIGLDANYAPAWAGLSTVHAHLYEWWGSNDLDLQSADRTSQIAMELAPNLADAHVARGFALSLHRRYDEAQVHYESATRINPNLFDVHYYFGRMAFARGQIQRSADLFRRAAEIRQEDFQSLFLLGQSLRMLGHTDEARAINRESIVRAERILALNPLDGRVLSLGSGALQDDGQLERAFEWSRRSLELYPDDMSTLMNAACMQAKLGKKDAAIEFLERAMGRGWGKLDWIANDPDYDILRDDPRFQRLLTKLK